ncbi:MAG: menaquinone biosynthesis decarboxylase [Bacteroidales bacterium]|jgi:4-hydroxy-3-polyprenylbenzoate decarboxylase
MYNSLKDYVEFLDSRGELIRIKEFVDPVLEIAEITDRMSKQPGGGKALLFENTGTSFPVLTNMMGSRERIAYALGVDSFNEIPQYINTLLKELTQERPSLLDKLKLLPHLKEAADWMPTRHKGDAHCQEVVLFKPELSRLPILQCWPEDGGRFITLPLVHTQDQRSGIRNLGMYRMQVFSEGTTGMHWHRHKTGAKHFADCKTNQFPVAIALGGDPVYTYAATAPLPEGIDEYLMAGFLRNKAVSLVDCLTQPLRVPADCDFIIEGYIDKNDPLVTEGPFGDHTGFYSLADLYPTLHITCITHKKDAIYPATLVGVPPQEDKYIAYATEKIFLLPIQLTMAPELTDLYLPEEGTGHNIAVIKIKKSFPGQAIKVAHSLWGAGQMMFNKIMIAVNEDVDIRDWGQLFEAISRNYSPRRDTHFSRGPLDVLDHSAPQCGYGGKVLFDATVKYPEEMGGSAQPVNEASVSGVTKAFHFTHNENDLKGTINILLDPHTDLNDQYLNLWLWGNNCDPIRDCKYIDGKLLMDSRSKARGINVREWPTIAHSSSETIESVDNKWPSLGLGEFIPSPSLRFLKS